MKNGIGTLLMSAMLGAAIASTGCEDPSTRPLNWQTIHSAVILPNCTTASCHTSFAKAAGVTLESPKESYDFLVTQEAFIVPFDLNSPMLYLLRGQERIRMPPDAPLPDADVDWIRDWIAAGAQR